MSAKIRLAPMAALALVLAGPVAATTYTVNLTLDDAYRSYLGRPITDPGPVIPGGSLSIKGRIVTDGATGIIDSSHLLSWRFFLDDGTFRKTIDSDGTTGPIITAQFNNLNATAAELVSSPDTFMIFYNTYNDGLTTIVAGWAYQGHIALLNAGDWTETTDAFGLKSTDGYSVAEDTGGFVVGLAVPLPASLPLLAAGLAGLGLVAARRRAG